MLLTPRHVATAVRDYCDRHNVTRKDFALWAGISVPTLTTLLQGTRTPQRTVIEACACALTLTPEQHRDRIRRKERTSA